MSVAASDAPLVNPKLVNQRARFTYRSRTDEPKVIGRVTPEKKLETERIVADKTLKTFISIWDRKITSAIHRLGMGEYVDDIKQDIYLFMSRRDEHGRTGLEAYDPEKAALSSYVYWLVNVKALNFKAKLKRDRLQLATKPKDDPLEGRYSPQSDERSEFWLQLERILSELDDCITSDSSSFFTQNTDSDRRFFGGPGRLITRDPRTVIELLLQGVTRPELHKALHCSVEEVDEIFAKLQQHEDLKDLLEGFEGGE